MRIKQGILFSLLTTLGSLSTAHASTPLPEWFVGLQGGYANTNFSTGTVVASPQFGGVPVTSASIANHVVGARAYGGYRWGHYFSAEAGYLRLRSTSYSNINGSSVADGDISEFAIDFRGKGYLPVPSHPRINPYLQLGAAYLDVNSHGGIVSNGSTFAYSLNPVFGLGIGYDFLPYLTGDVSWARITGRNTNVPPIDLYFVGLTYRFSGCDAVNRAMANDHNYSDESDF